MGNGLGKKPIVNYLAFMELIRTDIPIAYLG